MALGLDLVDDAAQTAALTVGQALGNTNGARVRHEHSEPAGQRHFLGQASALGADGVLGDLANNGLAGANHLFDATLSPALGRLDVVGVEGDITAVEHGVLRNTNVDEGQFHAGQHVLDATDVDVAVDLVGLVGRLGDGVLDQRSTFEGRNVGRFLRGVDAHQVAALQTGRAVSATTTAALGA